jgi:UMF1 family MFS transporter
VTTRAVPAGAGHFARPAGIAGWVLFDLASQPFFTLVTTFIFAPYFAAHVAADPARGQALWGYATGAAGLTIAVLAPVLGAIADESGRRKAWIAGFSVLLVMGSAALWLAVPGAPAAVPLALVGYIIAAIGAEFATVFTNAMMPSLAPPQAWGRLSGTGWAVGYAGGLTSLFLVLACLIADPSSGRTLAGIEPWFGLDPARHEGERATGPLSALWYLVFVLPLFLFTPDAPARKRFGEAAAQGLGRLRQTLRGLRHERNLVTYLAAHLLKVDGLVALFAFGGIYAAGVLGWSTREVGIFGILLTITGTAGAFLGGRLDDRFGPKSVLVGSLIGLILASIGILSIDRDRLFFLLEVAPRAAGDAPFTSAPEQLYLALGGVIGLLAGPVQSAGRSLLARLAPADRRTQLFGLYALAGKVTSFSGPLAVAVLTSMTGDQRAGIAVLVLYFTLAAMLMTRVTVPPLSGGSAASR